MGTRKLIILFGVFYLLCFTSIKYEKYVFERVKTEISKNETALNEAAALAAEFFAKSVYEDEAVVLAERCFELSYGALMGKETGEEIEILLADVDEIGFGINGRNCNTSNLQNAGAGDCVSIYVRLKPKEISVPGRKFYYERSVVQSRTID